MSDDRRLTHPGTVYLGNGVTGIRCGPPYSLTNADGGKRCSEKATVTLSMIRSGNRQGGWYLCELCLVRVVLWLEDSDPSLQLETSPMPEFKEA